MKKKTINNFSKNKNYICQKYIIGKEYTVDCFFDYNGKLMRYLPRERIKSKDVSIIGKTEDNKLIGNFTQKLSLFLKFVGPINIQIIISKKKIYLIEINPRISGSIFFSMKSGFNPFKYSIQLKNNELKKIFTSKFKYNQIFYRYWKSSN